MCFRLDVSRRHPRLDWRSHLSDRADFTNRQDAFATPSDAIARAIAFAIEQPADVDLKEIVVRPTAQK